MIYCQQTKFYNNNNSSFEKYITIYNMLGKYVTQGTLKQKDNNLNPEFSFRLKLVATYFEEIANHKRAVFND